jgi:hypothetical protein
MEMYCANDGGRAEYLQRLDTSRFIVEYMGQQMVNSQGLSLASPESGRRAAGSVIRHWLHRHCHSSRDQYNEVA